MKENNIIINLTDDRIEVINAGHILSFWQKLKILFFKDINLILPKSQINIISNVSDKKKSVPKYAKAGKNLK